MHFIVFPLLKFCWNQVGDRLRGDTVCTLFQTNTQGLLNKAHELRLLAPSRDIWISYVRVYFVLRMVTL
jgi:hypothetical protein